MREVKRAQVSVEFLLVTALAMFLLASATYIMFDFTRGAQEANGLETAARVGYEVIDQARLAYVQGEGSFFTISATMPENFLDAYVVENDTLVFVVGSDRGELAIPMFSDVPINGTRSVGERTYIYNDTQSAHGGRNRYRVISHGSWVELRQV